MPRSSRPLTALIGYLLFECFAPPPGVGAEEPRSRSISVEQGLSQSSIWCILQDHYGFLWFGTADGLNRYDGASFVVYRHDPLDSASLSDNTAWSLAEDNNGDIWVGTGGGVNQFHRATNSFTRLRDDPRLRNSPARGQARSFVLDHEGALWLATPTGCVSYDPRTGTQRHLPPSVSRPGTIPLWEDNDSIMWIGSPGRLLRYQMRSGSVEDAGVPVRGGHFIISALYRDRAGSYWVGTTDGLYESAAGRPPWRAYRHDADLPGSLSENTVRDICQDNNGDLWVATYYGGVNRLNPVSHTFSRFIPQVGPGSNKRFEGAVSLLCDRSGILWAGYDGAGIVKIDPGRRKFRHILVPPSGGKSTGDNFFKSIAVDRPGRIWLGTFDQGVAVYDRETGEVKRFPHDPRDPNSVADNRISALYEDRTGRVWVGTADGIDSYVPETSRFRHYPTPAGRRRPGFNLYITSFCEDSSGRLWAGSYSGLMKFDEDSEQFTGATLPGAGDASMDSVRIETLSADRKGLWIGTSTLGLVRFSFDGSTPLFFGEDRVAGGGTSTDLVKTIWLDGDTVLWAGTGMGLTRVDLRRRSWRHFYVADGLPNDFIYGVLMDRRRNLWISTNKGLSRMSAVDSGHPAFRNYTPDDGLQSYEFNTGVYCRTPSGEMLFGGVNGFNIFDPDSVRDNPVVPVIVITGFKKFDQPVSWKGDLNRSASIALKHSESVFSIEFAALEFTNPELNQYAYKMEGFDGEWIVCGTRREARYTNLDPGSYLFRVRGSNSDGVWNEAGASLAIMNATPYWKTWWAYSLYALAAVSGAIGVRWLASNWRVIAAHRRSRSISHYRLLGLLGEGGMGKVYEAADLNTRQRVALKILNASLLQDQENRRRLAAEGQLLSSFSHPHIVRVFEVGESAGRGYIAMEHLTGGTLREHLDASFPLPMPEALRLLGQICDGLAEIHARGVIHRDLKTGNIMLDASMNVRIMDFGLSKSPLVTTMTSLGTVIGTLGYVAPEQVTGVVVDHRVDIFSLGVIIYELLTRQLPFRGENEIAVIHSIFNTEPPPPSSLQPGIPAGFDRIVKKCISKNPAGRYASVAELRAELFESTID